MAIEYTMRAACDKCGCEIEPLKVVKVGEIDNTRWDWRRKWKAEGVMEGLPNRYGKYKLYCAKCAG